MFANVGITAGLILIAVVLLFIASLFWQSAKIDKCQHDERDK
jgi:hypothetical protein